MKKFLSILVSLIMLINIMSGLFSITYAVSNISNVEVMGIDTPLPGKALDLDGVTTSVGYTFASENPISWFDLSSNNSYKSIPKDSKFIEGHIYLVTVKLITKSGYEFATKNGSPSVVSSINNKNADVTRFGEENPKNYIAISYTFPACSKKYISSVKVEATKTIQKGTELTADLLKVTGEGVLGVVPTWNHNGVGVDYGTKIDHGNYGVVLTITADTGYCFDKGTVINFNNQYVYPSWVPSGWIMIARTDDDFFNVPCTHDNKSSEWSHDNSEHWHECINCNEKFDVESHTFDGGIVNGNVTTYTCSGCGYKKLVNGNTQGFTYASCGTGAEIVRYLGSDTNVNIPSEIGGLTVVRIGNQCFTNNTTIKNVTIPSKVKSIGIEAFSGCTNLASITIPSGVTKIERATFNNCSSITNINIPRGVSTIGSEAFRGCTKLESVIIPCGVTSIGNNAFMQCAEITKVVLPNTVTSLGTGVFSNCTKLKTAVVGKGVTSIPSSLFDTCSSLETVTLPTVTNINNYAFADDNSLTKVNFMGSEEEWNSITISQKDSYNKTVVNATKEYNYSKEDDIGQHNFQTTATVKPTCVDEGYTLYVCTGCGESYRDNIISATGVHTYNSGVITKDSTCVEKGEKTYTCNVCGHAHTEDVSATGVHTWNSGVVTKPATCTSTGVKTYTCTKCGETKTETIAKVAHTYKTSTTTTKATLKANGKIVTTKKCSVCGYVASTNTTAIAYPKTIKLKTKSYTYNGKVRKPGIVVTDSKGKTIASSNYKVTYSNKNSKNVGRYTVTIKFKGNYSGTKTLTYEIKPKGTKLSSLKKASKAFTAKWSKQKTQTTGYQIQYSTNSKFSKGNKTVTISKNSTTSKKVSKLKKNKKYYVRIRTYKTVKVNGKNVKIYSDWSKSKNVKTK